MCTCVCVCFNILYRLGKIFPLEMFPLNLCLVQINVLLYIFKISPFSSVTESYLRFPLLWQTPCLKTTWGGKCLFQFITQGKNLESGTEAEVMEEHRLLSHSMDGPSWSGSSYIYHLSRKCATFLPTGQFDGDNFSTEVSASKLLLLISSWHKTNQNIQVEWMDI